MRKLTAFILLMISTAAVAGTSAGYGNGGQFVNFDPVVNQYNQSGELFRIEGHCQSACTLFLGIKNVCVDRSATLLFHAGHDRNRNISAPATDHMLRAYNASLRGYVTSNHFMDTLAFHAISGGELIQKFGYRECPRKWAHGPQCPILALRRLKEAKNASHINDVNGNACALTARQVGYLWRV
jgi:hypothetical protein